MDERVRSLSEHRTTNSILTAAVVAVYLGLVLAGATPQLVAQTPQTQAIQRRGSESVEPLQSLSAVANAKGTASSGVESDFGRSSDVSNLDLSRPDALFRLSLAFAATDLAKADVSTSVTRLDEVLIEQDPQTADRVHNADLDAISSARFSQAVPLPRGSLAPLLAINAK